MQFKEHPLAHDGNQFCNMCEYATQNSEELRGHYREAHDVSSSPTGLNDAGSCGEEEQEQGLNQPKVTSSGKVKTFRCKQCSYSALTKQDFWEHTKGHIKVERLLTCPKCPFVTEYKHHFEYHLRNHFGSKPFKCDQCSYSCVNKSMLNSHLKSHSNIYQFGCKDCTYATKYCHSLKLHLRKYSHRPAMVLNPDGSPNPLPIVDVYGTRRGPKQRPKKSDDSFVSARSESSKSPLAGTSPMNPAPNGMLPEFGIMPPRVAQFPFSVLPHSMAFTPATQNLESNDRLSLDEFHQLKQLYLRNKNSEDFGNNETNSEVFPTSAPLDLSKAESNKYSSQNCEGKVNYGTCKNRRKGIAVKRIPSAAQLFGERDLENKMFDQTIHIPSPQFFCSPELLSPEKVRELEMINRRNSSLSTTDESQSTDSIDIVNPSARKGNSDFDETRALAITFEPETELSINETRVKEEKMDAAEEEERIEDLVNDNSNSASPENYCTNSTDENGNDFRCTYCDIIFKNLPMYSIHMGFHDHNDPFTCNMCGHKTKDEMAFYVHIAKFPHN